MEMSNMHKRLTVFFTPSVEQSPQKFSLTLQQRVAVDEQANEMQNSTDEWTDVGLVGSYQHTLEPLMLLT